MPGISSVTRLTDGWANSTSVLWGNLRVGHFEPCPLHTLAEYMRDGKWLDLFVEDVGLVMRVRIIEVVVRVRGEDIVFRQEWCAEGDGYCKGTFALDSETVWKVRPTLYGVLEVQPYVEPDSAHADLTGEQLEVVIEVATAEVVRVRGVDAEKVTPPPQGKQEQAVTDARHLLLLVVHQCSNVNHVDLCTRLGWKSQQPFLTAKYKATGAHADRDFRRQLKSCCESVRRKTGYAHARRNHGALV